jgi:hypothetical protein
MQGWHGIRNRLLSSPPFNVTDRPTSAWVAQQMMEAFGDRVVPRYLIRDRDWVLGQGGPSATAVDGNPGSPDRATEPLAERVRGAPDRIDLRFFQNPESLRLEPAGIRHQGFPHFRFPRLFGMCHGYRQMAVAMPKQGAHGNGKSFDYFR